MREQRSILHNIDWPIFAIYMVLVVMGWFNIYAAVYNEEHKSIFSLNMQYGKQVMFIGISLAVALVILFTDGKLFATFAFWIYGFMILLLIATIFIGAEIKGSHSWIRLGGGFSLQPAELSKFAVCLALARYLSNVNIKMEKLQTRLVCAAIICLPVAIILLQNETGMALVYTALVIVLYREGLPGGFLLLGFAALLLFVLSLLIEQKAILYSIIGVVALVYFSFWQTQV